MEHNQDNKMSPSKPQERDNMKKYTKVAYSMLALSMGLGIVPQGTGTAATVQQVQQTAVQLGSQAALLSTPNVGSRLYTGDSLQYFKNEFLKKPSLKKLSGEEIAVPPVASAPSISGALAVGQTITAEYTYFDVNGDLEDGTEFKWYRADDAMGTNKVLINGAALKTYVLTGADLGKYISFEVTPKNAEVDGTGLPVTSEPNAAVAPEPHKPVAASLSISGETVVGQTLLSTYAYMDQENDPQSGSVFQWYRADNASGLNKVAIEGATSGSYTLVQADLGKYISFSVVPKNESALLPTGDIKESTFVGAVTAAVTSNNTYAGVTTPSKQEEESLIEVVAVQQNIETTQAAKLNLTKEGDSIALASFNFMADGVTKALEEAANKETIAVRVRSLKNAQTVQGHITGDLVQAMAGKTQRLAMITGDVAINFPTVSIPVQQLSEGSGVAADQVNIQMKIEKQPEEVISAAAAYAAAQNAKLIGSPYKFSIAVQNGTESTAIEQYGNRYAYFTLPLPEGVADPHTLGAVMLVDGKYVPVPVRIVDAEHAVVETPTNATVMLIQRNTTFTDLGSHWGANDLMFMTNKANMTADASGAFDPKGTVSRSDLASILVSSLGLGQREKVASSDAAFKDLPADSAAAEDVKLAVEAGLFTGYPNGTFNPDAPTTREQLVAVLMRFYNNFELELPAVNNSTLNDSFKDASKGSEWAKQYMEEASRGGVIFGFEDDTIGASKALTRDEAAAIIRRFLLRTNLTN